MRKAFTLIELLVYMALMGLFLIVLSNILVTSLETLTQSSQVAAVDADGRFILARLAYDVGRATTMSVSSGTLTLDVGTYTVSNGNLMLGSDRLNSFDSSVANFVATRIGNGMGRDTVKISFDLTSGSKISSLSTTLGLR